MSTPSLTPSLTPPARRRFSTSLEEARELPGSITFQPSKYHAEMLLEDDPLPSCMKVKTLKESLKQCKPSLKPNSPSRSGGSRRSLFFASSRRSSSLFKIGISMRNLIISSPSRELEEEKDPDSPINQVAPAEEERLSSTMSSDDGNSSNKTKKRGVQFSDIFIRLYDIIADDNPSVTGKGPAIALSWTFCPQPTETVDDYEMQLSNKPRRKVEELKLSLADRQKRLLESGASRNEINEYAKRAYKAKLQRLKTREEMNMYGVSYSMKRIERREKIGRFFKRLFGIRRTYSKEHAALWEAAAVAAQQKRLEEEQSLQASKAQ